MQRINIDMTKDELEKLKNTNIRDIDRNSLVDINDVEINPSLPVEEKIKSYIEQIKNPYIFKCGETVVRMKFQENSGWTFQDCMEVYLSSIS